MCDSINLHCEQMNPPPLKLATGDPSRRMRSTTGFHAGVIGFFNTSTTPISLVASSTDASNAPEIAMINSSGFASWSF